MNTRQVFTRAMTPGLEYTIDLMRELHAGQMDQSGHPYEGHPIRVAQNLIRFFPEATEDMVKAALLHDTLEDCGIDEDFLRQRGYSENCIRMVRLVTKPENDTRSYAQVIGDLIASGDEGAMKIKIADNAENLHPERAASLKAINPEKARSLEARYRESIGKLCSAVDVDMNYILSAIEESPPISAIVNNLTPN